MNYQLLWVEVEFRMFLVNQDNLQKNNRSPLTKIHCPLQSLSRLKRNLKNHMPTQLIMNPKSNKQNLLEKKQKLNIKNKK